MVAAPSSRRLWQICRRFLMRPSTPPRRQVSPPKLAVNRQPPVARLRASLALVQRVLVHLKAHQSRQHSTGSRSRGCSTACTVHQDSIGAAVQTQASVAPGRTGQEPSSEVTE